LPSFRAIERRFAADASELDEAFAALFAAIVEGAQFALYRRTLRASREPGREPLRSLKMETVKYEDEVDVKTAAEITGTTTSAVRARCNRETLSGRRDDLGRWWIPRAALESK
jgi:hypothetical protein